MKTKNALIKKTVLALTVMATLSAMLFGSSPAQADLTGPKPPKDRITRR
jgi:hypothetical protein